MGIAQKAAEIAEPVINSLGFELVDTEYIKEGSKQILRLYVDKQGGINIDECEVISKAVEGLIDEADFVKNAYVFEVSSPGLNRPFKTDKDFERYKGEEVEVTLYAQEEGEKNFEGILEKKENGNIYITTGKNESLVFSEKKVACVKRTIKF